jgi:hypothetical protein
MRKLLLTTILLTLLSFTTTQAQSDNHKILAVTIANSIDGNMGQVGEANGTYLTKISTQLDALTIGLRLDLIMRDYTDVSYEARWLRVNSESFDYACLIKFGKETFLIGFNKRAKALLIIDSPTERTI